MVKNLYFFISLLSLLGGCATIPESPTIVSIVTIEPLRPLEPPKERPTEKIPYWVDIRFDENGVNTEQRGKLCGTPGITYEFHTGKFLKEAIGKYFYPSLGRNRDKDISVTLTFETYCMENQGQDSVEVRLDAYVYYDGMILFQVYGKGWAPINPQLANNSIHDATEKAVIEAVKNVANQIVSSLSNLDTIKAEYKKYIEKKILSYRVIDKYHYVYIEEVGRVSLHWFTTAHIKFANISRLTKHYEEGIAAAKRAIELDPNNSAGYAVLGLIYKDQGNYKEAETYFKKAIEIEQKGQVRDYRAEDILALLRPVIEIEPGVQGGYYFLSKLYLDDENYERAIDVLRKALELNESNLKSLQMLSVAYMHMGNYRNATDILNKVIESNMVTGIGAQIHMAENYPMIKSIIEGGPAEKAGVKAGDKIIEVNGQSTKEWDENKVRQNLRGPEGTTVKIKVERKGQDKPLEFVIPMGRLISKEIAPAFAMRAFAYRELGQNDAFFKDAEQAYLLNPDDGWAKSAKATLLIDKGNYDQALKILSTAKGSNFDKILETIAYIKVGDFNNAVRIYQELPEDFFLSKSKFLQTYLASLQYALKPYKDSKLQIAMDLEKKGQYKEAIKEYAEYLKFADEKKAKEVRSHIAEVMIKYPHLFALPEEARKAVIRAETYTSEGKFEKAIEEYKNALKLQPFFPALYKALALNYAQIKDYKKAIRNMNIYLELYPDAPDARAAKDEIYRWEFLMEKGE